MNSQLHFFTEPTFDEKTIQAITTKLKSNKSIDYEKNETGKNDSLQESMVEIKKKIDSINKIQNLQM